MGKIVISTNVTLDGVVQDPDGQEGFERGGWFHESASTWDFTDWVANETKEAVDASALLLGRRSFEWFASRAPAMGERVSRQWADRMNDLPKYVVSSTLERPGWSNATVIGRNPAKAVPVLKRTVDGDILVYGSGQLVRTLIAHDLADELRLVVFPVALGKGQRLFGDVLDRKPLQLVDTRRLGDGLAHITYRFAPVSSTEA
jgi:dihydrofolate reductase